MNNDKQEKDLVNAAHNADTQKTDTAPSRTDAPSKGLPAYMMPGDSAPAPSRPDDALPEKEAPEETARQEHDNSVFAKADSSSVATADLAFDATDKEPSSEASASFAAASPLAKALHEETQNDDTIVAVAPDGTAVVAEGSYEEDAVTSNQTGAARPATDQSFASKATTSAAPSGRLDSPAWSYTATQTGAPAQQHNASATNAVESDAVNKNDSAKEKPSNTTAPQSGKKSLFGKKSKSAAPSAPKAKSHFPPFASTHPVLGVEQSLPQSVGSRLFSGFALLPLLPLTLMLVLQTVFSLNARALWAPDEVRFAQGVSAMIASGSFMPVINGLAESATPLYYWFVRALAFVIPTESPLLHFSAAAISALLFLWSALALGRLAARVDRRSNLAAGIVLLSTASVLGLMHYGGGTLLFAALICASHTVLYRALVSPKPETGLMVPAFLLAALAALIKGPAALGLPCVTALLFALWRGNRAQWLCIAITTAALLWGLASAWFALPLAQQSGLIPAEAQHMPTLWLATLLGLPALLLLLGIVLGKTLRVAAALALILLGLAFVLGGGLPEIAVPETLAVPLLALLLLLSWQATPQRPFRADFFIGLGASLLLLGLWFGWFGWYSGGLDSLRATLQNVDELARIAQGLKQGVHPAALLCTLAFFLPWTILLVCLPWQRILGKNARQNIAASRHPEKEGLAFLWCIVLAAPLVALSVHQNTFDIFMAALAPLALLFGRAALGLSGKQATLFRYAMALMLCLCGLLTVIGALMLFDVLPMPAFLGLPAWVLPSNGGFFVAGALLLVLGALMWVGLSSSRPEGVLLLTALGTTALGYLFGALVMPGFDPVMSPKDPALLLRAYVDKGYSPAALGNSGSQYAFYAGKIIPDISADKANILAEEGNFVLAAPQSLWDELDNKHDCLVAVHEQWVGAERHVLLACPPIEALEPAPLPYANADDLLPDLLDEARKRLDTVLPDAAPDADTTAPPAAPEQDAAPAPGDSPEREEGQEGEQETVEQKATEPGATEPEATEQEATEQKATEPDAAEPEATAPEATESEAPAPQEKALEPVDQQTPEPALPENDTTADPKPEAPAASGNDAHSAPASGERPATPSATPSAEPSAAPSAEPSATHDKQPSATPAQPAQEQTTPEQQVAAPERQEKLPEQTPPHSPAGEQEQTPAQRPGSGQDEAHPENTGQQTP